MRDGPADRGTGATGLKSFRRYTWWAVPGSAAAYLLIFIGGWIADPDEPAWARAVAGGALPVTVAASVILLGRRLALPAGAHRGLPVAGWPAAGVAGAVVLGAVPLAAKNYGLWVVAPATMVAIIATYLPPRRRWRLLGGATAAAAVPGTAVSLIAGDGELAYAALFPPGMVAAFAWVIFGPLLAWDIAGKLDRARTLSAELAVKDERLRFAADLHDIQGHHLQVIALKGELAARLAATDPARAAAEMTEVQKLAIEALRDTRAVVQGYRRTTLDDEIANAAKVLAAADIDARMTLDPGADPIATPGRHLLGLVMREATTNVLRHSRARHAEIDYRMAGGLARLRVSNDGATGRGDARDGTGLRALTERLAAAGGELTWARDGDRFEVVASLPAGTDTDAGADAEAR